MATQVGTIRSVARVIHGIHQTEGGGFVVRRTFPGPDLSMIDPFLLLDEMGPADYGPGEAVGALDHPHRGFETVTYMLEGTFHHRDSMGTEGWLHPGAVQWMTAGAGIVHSEMPSDEIIEKGGRVHGFQLWVNLPAADKMKRPRYQEYPAEQVPTAVSDDGKVWVRVIAGEALDARAIIETHSPIQYLHYVLEPGASVNHAVPESHNAFAYVVKGKGRFGKDGREGVEGDNMAFARNGDTVAIANSGTEPLSLLLLSGVPLNEPVARYGPFVMNTKEEIYQAIEDFKAGRMGRIDPEVFKSR